MSDSKIDRTNLGRRAHRKESYMELVSKRKYVLSQSRNIPSKRSTTEFTQHFGLSCNNEDNVDKENVDTKNYMTCTSSSNSESSHSDASQDFEPGILSNFKTVKESQQELELSSVMTRSATRKCASVGALHYKVDWDQQLKIRKCWPANVAYKVEGPIVQNSMLRDLLSRSLIEVMSFCKNVCSLDDELQSPEMEENQLWECNENNFYRLTSHITQGQQEIHESYNDQASFQLENVIISFLDDEGQRGEVLYIPEENDECETITLHADETYIIGSEHDLNEGLEDVHHLDPMIAVLNDHNYAQRCDVIHIPDTQAENVILENEGGEKVVKKEEAKEFKLENALNDLLLNTAILKCLVCGQSPQEMISFLDRAQEYYT